MGKDLGNKTVFFKQWSNKAYSVFNSLNKVIKICALATTYSIILLPKSTFAQVDTTASSNSTYELEEVEVSANRVPDVYNDNLRVITVIQQSEIRQAPVQNIAELLEYSSGLDVRQRGVFGVQSDISIRGGSFNQVLILLNGVKISDPQTGHHNMDLPVSLEDIERIEILQGPGARIHGMNAFSGAINIITKKSENDVIALSLNGGENNYYAVSSSLSKKIGKTHNYLSINKKGCDGYIKDSTDFDILNIFYRGTVGQWDYQLGYNTKKFGATTFYTESFPNQYEETSTYFANLSYSTGKKIHFTPKIYWRGHQDYFVLKRENPSFYQNDHFSNLIGIELNSYFYSKYGRTAFGIESKYESILSTALGDDFGDSIKVFGTSDRYFTKRKSRLNTSFFIDQYKAFNKIHLSVGAMVNLNSKFDAGFFPGIELGYDLSSSNRLFASVNKAFRLPTFTELYYPGLLNTGNPNLLPEQSLTEEIGIKHQSLIFKYSLTAFARQGNNIIDWVKSSSTTRWISSNITRLNTVGLTADFQFFIKRKYKSFPIKLIDINYTYVEATKQNGEYISKYALDFLNHKLSIGALANVYKNLYLKVNGSYQDRKGTYSTKGTEQDYEPFFLLDARLFFQKERYFLYIEASNLLNVKYRDIGSVIMPQRWVKIGLSVNLKFHKR